MRKYKQLNVPIAVWEQVVAVSTVVPGKSPSQWALDVIRNAAFGLNAVQSAPKPTEKKKNKDNNKPILEEVKYRKVYVFDGEEFTWLREREDPAFFKSELFAMEMAGIRTHNQILIYDLIEKVLHPEEAPEPPRVNIGDPGEEAWEMLADPAQRIYEIVDEYKKRDADNDREMNFKLEPTKYVYE